MSLRPRYSLLTLLILTTLVAGGVKLWYGPHHVVEERVSGMTLEYTYTRDWRGEKIVDGPSTIRLLEPQDQRFFVAVVFFKQNKQLPFYYVLFRQDLDYSGPVPIIADLEVFVRLPLTTSELAKFRQAVELVRVAKDQDPGKGMAWCEYLDESRGVGMNEFREWVREWERIYQYHFEK